MSLPEVAAAAARPTNEEFSFKHRVFSVSGCVFRKGGDGHSVLFFFPLGDALVSVPVDKILATFEIPADSEDAALLRRIGDALKYVREIRPGDSLPSEIIDGRASWMVDEKYSVTAKARISLQLVAWLSGNHNETFDMHELVVMAEKPETRAKVQQAFASLAERLGFGPERRQEVVDLVDRFTVELSYIEALRDRFGALHRILTELKSLCSVYRRDRTTVEMITRCSTLLSKPIQQVFARFDTLDANTGEILSTLQRFDKQVAYVREVRDELRETYLLWEELIALWEVIKPVAGPETERALQTTYRFAARNFSSGRAWSAGA